MLNLLWKKYQILARELYSWRESYQTRKDYCTKDRRPFYDVAGKYLPDDAEQIIVDIGAGEGGFAEYLKLSDRFRNLYLLDANSLTIECLKGKLSNVILYKAPEPLPFEDGTVSYVHCSHIVEHLYYSELYSFLKEIDRVLNKGGILVITTPLLWGYFYKDLSHVKPYYPSVFINYLCRQSKQRSTEAISANYVIAEQVYRYTTECFEEWGSEYLFIDFVIQFSKKVLNKLGIKKYTKNGYTLVLRKR
jgi:ubiquinone/menaquinone biosynthesis C-methylase UbiE